MVIKDLLDYKVNSVVSMIEVTTMFVCSSLAEILEWNRNKKVYSQVTDKARHKKIDEST
jgi:hypothetical protein